MQLIYCGIAPGHLVLSKYFNFQNLTLNEKFVDIFLGAFINNFWTFFKLQCFGTQILNIPDPPIKVLVQPMMSLRYKTDWSDGAVIEKKETY